MKFRSEDCTAFSLTEVHLLARKMQWSIVTFQAAGQKLPCTFISLSAELQESHGRSKSFIMESFQTQETCPRVNIVPDLELWGYDLQLPKSFLRENIEETEDPIQNKIEFEKDLAINAKSQYVAAVEKAQEFINKGEFQKLVIARLKKISLKNDHSTEVFFKAMTENYPQAFCYCVYHPAIGSWSGASPELLLSYRAEEIKTSALAGTLTEAQLEQGWSAKEVEEHEMVVEYIKSALDQKVKQLKVGIRKTVQAGPVFHLRTAIKAKISNNKFTSILQALHPTPAVAGLPFKNSIETINTIENFKREYYCGFIGVLKAEDNADVFVNLRCLKWLNEKTVQLFIGAGITAASIPEDEWFETEAKAKTMEDLLL